MSIRHKPSTLALEAEIALLRQEVDRLSTDADDTPGHGAVVTIDTDDALDDGDRANIYVFDDDDEEARAFDEFYRAYDEVHAKTREFLLD
ncbi:MAG: hypothetical protein ACFCVK_06755 [Acidimicrobiales bacterium]